MCEYSTPIDATTLNLLPTKQSDDGPHKQFYDDEYNKGLAHLSRIHAQHYENKSLSGWLELQFKKSLVELYVSGNGLHLEVGCGAGSSYETLSPLGQYVGVDINLDLLSSFRERYPEAKFVAMDITTNMIKANSIGSIFCLATLEHIYYLESFLLAIDRILSDEGYFYVMIPTEGGLFWGILRQLSAMRFDKRKNGFDYKHLARKEHCNSAYAIDSILNKFFIVEERRYFPLRLESVTSNFSISYRLRKRRRS